MLLLLPPPQVGAYKSALTSKRREVDEMVARLDGGLQKLVQAAAEVRRLPGPPPAACGSGVYTAPDATERGRQQAAVHPPLLHTLVQVDVMQKELVQAQVVVQAASQECDRLLTEITTSTADAEAKQAAALAKEAQLATDSEAIAVEKAEAEAALALAIPALEEAAAALSNLKKDDITQIKSYNNPPVMVQKVRTLGGLAAAAVLGGGRSRCWRAAGGLLRLGPPLVQLAEQQQ